MMAADHRELYRWKRQTDAKPYKAAKPPTDDIREWMKRVEDASEAAAAAAFGLHKTSGKGHGVKLTSIEQLRDHNDTYDEAQELVSEWMSSKGALGFEDNLEDEIWSEDRRQNSKLDSDLSIDRIVQEATGFCLNGDYPAPNPTLMDLDNYDEHAVAEDILKAMMQKEVVRPEILADLGLDTGQSTNGRLKQRNPIVKMELRQQQVKENRERRQKEAEKRRLEIKNKRESLFVAKQLQLKEEKEKIVHAKREEAEIQQEMARIRKELAEERRIRDDSRKKQQQGCSDDSPRTPKAASIRPALSTREEPGEVEAERQPRGDAPPPLRSSAAAREQPGSRAGGSGGGRWAERSKEARKRLHHEKIKVQQARSNSRCLLAHFGAWYGMVVERRAQLGRALAVADWKRLLRAWNGWRTAVRHSRMDREQLEHESHLKELYRKQQAADRFFQSGLLRKYFIEWQLWVLRQQEERNLEEVQHSFRSKMASFLDAASQNCAALHTASDQSSSSALSACRSGTKAEHDASKSKSSAREGKAPALAWPLTRRYEQFMSGTAQARAGHSSSTAAAPVPVADDDAVLSPTAIRQPAEGEALEKAGMPKRGTEGGAVASDADVAVPRTFASRFAAQQRALHEQRRQLQEQQRLIAELKFEQDRRALEEQAQQSRLLGEQLQALAQQLLASRTAASASGVPSASAAVPAAAAVAAAAASGSRSVIGGGTPRTEGFRSGISAAVEPSSAPEPLTDRSAASSSAAASTHVSAAAGAPSHTRFVEAMNERASARARAKAEREERRRKAENEKLLQMRAAEEDKQRKEEEEKRQQQLLLQERRRLEAQRKAEKQQQAERLVQLNTAAVEHSTLRLLRCYAWSPWRSLVASVRESASRAAAHHAKTLLRTCLLAWRDAVKEVIYEREQAATALYHRHLLARSFSNWKKWRMQAAIMDQKADRFYARVTRQRVLKAWLDYVTTEKIETWEKERFSTEHCKLRLLRTAFSVWRQLPLASRREKERAKRREDMRRKVALLLPDFERVAVTSSQESQSSGV